MTKHELVNKFYSLIDDLEDTVGGKQKLRNCHEGMNWPDRGVYFFIYPDETTESSSPRGRVMFLLISRGHVICYGQEQRDCYSLNSTSFILTVSNI